MVRIDRTPLTAAERKHAKILYAKYKRKWWGVDQQTRLKWLAQIAKNAPQRRRVLATVWVWFCRDFEHQEAQRAKERIEAEARAQKAEAEAEAKACEIRRARLAELNAARAQAEDVAIVRGCAIENQRDHYIRRVTGWFMGLSLVVGYWIAGQVWGWRGIGVLVSCGFSVLPVVLHWAACYRLAQRFGDWNFRPVEPDQAEIERRLKGLHEYREKLKRKAAQAQLVWILTS